MDGGFRFRRLSALWGRARVSRTGLLWMLLPGFLFSYLLYVFRLSLLIVLGELFHRVLPAPLVAQILSDLIHAQLGWVLCLGGTALWFFVTLSFGIGASWIGPTD